jgi:dephospho-CoA kinase
MTLCSSDALQLQRLMERDNSSREDALARLKSQLPIADKVDYADVVVDNSGSLHDLEDQVDNMVQKLERQAGWIWRVSWLCPPFGILSAVWMITCRYIRHHRRRRHRQK